MGGYPPGLPPLQGPVDGLVSMGSMQPLHPGGPPPHHLPPGVPGLPGIPPPGKNIILIHSLISFFYILFPPSATSSRGHLLPMVARLPSLRIPELSAVGPILHLSRWPTTTCALCIWQQHRMRYRGQTYIDQGAGGMVHYQMCVWNALRATTSHQWIASPEWDIKVLFTPSAFLHLLKFLSHRVFIVESLTCTISSSSTALLRWSQNSILKLFRKSLLSNRM